MNLSDLRMFVMVAKEQSLVTAAERLHLTPSAVSKALRRLEEGLGVALFDRHSRQLTLNACGTRLVERAHVILALADQARADVRGDDAEIDCRIGGPAVLLWHEASRIAAALRCHPHATVRMQALFEDDALTALARADLGAALVTGAVVQGRGAVWSENWDSILVGQLVLALVAGRTHPLVAAQAGAAMPTCHATSTDVLAHAFACPTRSLFCGQTRGTRSDGWRDELVPRQIRYWTDDLHLLLTLVKNGQALAYLPDAAVTEHDLVRVDVPDYPFSCNESSWLVWDRRTAPQWLVDLGAALAHPVQTPAL